MLFICYLETEMSEMERTPKQKQRKQKQEWEMLVLK